jgi:hypothetical protein
MAGGSGLKDATDRQRDMDMPIRCSSLALKGKLHLRRQINTQHIREQDLTGRVWAYEDKKK